MTGRPPRTIFGFEQHKTGLSREVIAGLTTFTTMSCIVVVNPALSLMLPDLIFFPLLTPFLCSAND